MSEMTAKKKRIGNAIVWSAIMIASALILKGQESYQVLMFLYIAGWFATNSLIEGAGGFYKAECAAFRRWLGKEKA